MKLTKRETDTINQTLKEYKVDVFYWNADGSGANIERTDVSGQRYVIRVYRNYNGDTRVWAETEIFGETLTWTRVRPFTKTNLRKALELR